MIAGDAVLLRRRARGSAAIIVAAVLACQAIGASQKTDDPNLIVVTATLPQLKQAVDKCIAGGCTSREDIIASVRYAEGQFRKGDYASARLTLAKSVSRNEKAATADPIAVSQLYEAQATVAAHYGDRSEVEMALRDSARVLRDTMPMSTMSFNADMRLIDFRAETDPIIAVGSYGIFADRARKAGRPVLALAAQLRQAWLISRRREDSRARRLLESIIASTAAGADIVRLAARITMARLAREKGDMVATDLLLAEIAHQPSAKRTAGPILISSPPMPKPYDESGTGAFDMVVRDTFAGGSFRLQWIDVGFWIKSNGQVDALEILRGSRSNAWAAPILKMIADRRYAAMPEDEGNQGQYRVERYTLTADFDRPTGSLIRQRGRNPRFEQLDLSEQPPAG